MRSVILAFALANSSIAACAEVTATYRFTESEEAWTVDSISGPETVTGTWYSGEHPDRLGDTTGGLRATTAGDRIGFSVPADMFSGFYSHLPSAGIQVGISHDWTYELTLSFAVKVTEVRDVPYDRGFATNLTRSAGIIDEDFGGSWIKSPEGFSEGTTYEIFARYAGYVIFNNYEPDFSNLEIEVFGAGQAELETAIITLRIVPEPSTLVLSGFGALALLAYWDRRCRSVAAAR